jgi:hypothetical protein
MKVTLSEAEAEQLASSDPREAAGWNALRTMLGQKPKAKVEKENSFLPNGWPKKPEGKSKGGRERVW